MLFVISRRIGTTNYLCKFVAKSRSAAKNAARSLPNKRFIETSIGSIPGTESLNNDILWLHFDPSDFLRNCNWAKLIPSSKYFLIEDNEITEILKLYTTHEQFTRIHVRT